MKSLVLFLVLLLPFSCGHAQEDNASGKVLSYVESSLTKQGVLRATESIVYVDVDDSYVHELISLIQDQGFEKPPYFGRGDLVGAHITVIYPSEIRRSKISHIEECGEVISWSLKRCKVVHPPNWRGVDQVYLIEVDAPQLDRIREKYGLPSKEYEFHITIGVKSEAIQAAS